MKAKESRAAAERAIRHERSLHVIEGRREARAHQMELERRAQEAAHMATFAGLMNPFDWDLSAVSSIGSASSGASAKVSEGLEEKVEASSDKSGAPAAKGGSMIPDFSRFSLFT